MNRIKSFVKGEWVEGKGNFKKIYNPVTGEEIGEISSYGIDFKGMLEYAREIGSKQLRNMTFHERARILKSIAQYLMQRKDEFYPLSYMTGATKADSWIDIEGGIATFFTYASKGKRELPDETIWVEGQTEILSKSGTFVGQHICVPLQGCAVHINAFNFPCWGMLEKLAPTFLAGMPAIVKPASISAYLTQAVVKAIIESNLLPEGALQLICGDVGDLFDHLTGQDVVTFTGSAETGRKLKAHPKIIENSVRFNMEADSLNCSILGLDVTPEMEEFNLFIKEVVNEMTVKAGQKCTAIRRTIVPLNQMHNVVNALKEKLSKVKVGNPTEKDIKMGSLIGVEQCLEVKEKVSVLSKTSEIVFGDNDSRNGTSAFFEPVLLQCNTPLISAEPHEVEAFGPVNTVMPYKNIDEAIQIANKANGSLVASLFTTDDEFAKKIVLGIGAYHGRVMILNRYCAKESTGHGSPLPHLVHGGPGRAGGGEEMGGIRGILKYMQRTALQGHPNTLTNICNQWIKGGEQLTDKIHPFKKYWEEIQIGETYFTNRRTITETDIVNFAAISGDHFYAHTDDLAARNSIFEKRVAHGYFILSAAAGLFVDPFPGPVLANYGLEGLRFIKPVYPGDTISATLTCKKKTTKEKKENEPPQGIVEWHVEVKNQNNDIVAAYTILTLVKRKEVNA
ncbi:phenylacetic acid degradation bifunctional protein PaaZ [Melioribacteraceae bacterium 4301-Me]|uniref:phenylacetic acid degradation bifunctional protein PaaZ n=1 Tax=Pyranulibacter aquaticus TaxID=3163344 RepID=UPI003594F18A